MSPEEIERLHSYLHENVHFSRLLGLRIDRIGEGRAEFVLDIEQKHMNGAGTVHGGVHASIMDSAMAVALISRRLRASTTNMTLNYVAPVSGGRVRCVGEIVHLGRRSAVTEARMFDEDGNLLALATASFRIFDREGWVGGRPVAATSSTTTEAQ